jgi:hypothetical protein
MFEVWIFRVTVMMLGGMKWSVQPALNHPWKHQHVIIQISKVANYRRHVVYPSTKCVSPNSLERIICKFAYRILTFAKILHTELCLLEIYGTIWWNGRCKKSEIMQITVRVWVSFQCTLPHAISGRGCFGISPIYWASSWKGNVALRHIFVILSLAFVSFVLSMDVGWFSDGKNISV